MEQTREAFPAGTPARGVSAGGRTPGARWLAAVGKLALAIARHAGELTLLIARIARYTVTGQVPLREILAQAYWMGVLSLPLVLITAVLSGVVTSQQGGYQFTGSVPLYVLGSIVVASVVLELGPVMTAIVLIGRVGARITAEFGTMQVSEQMDALHSLGRDPVRVLAAPRLLAGIVVVPLLVGIADAVGIFSGMIAAQLAVGLGREAFFYGARLYWHNWDLFYSIGKAVAFGFVIPLIAIHVGFRTRGGAEGVGKATTRSVMAMTLAVLFLDALFPPLFLN
ncbi:MAG: MlaE family ABC transporter permease [Longimicrobiales bacterium]